MSKVIVLGSANTDLTVKAKRLPRPNETVTDGEFMVSFGGKGANQALAAQMAGAEVFFWQKSEQMLMENNSILIFLNLVSLKKVCCLMIKPMLVWL